MRELDAQTVTQAVRQLCIDANRVLPADLEAVIQDCSQREKDETARSILCDLCRNLDAARADGNSHLPGYGHGGGLCRSGPGPAHQRGL